MVLGWYYCRVHSIVRAGLRACSLDLCVYMLRPLAPLQPHNCRIAPYGRTTASGASRPSIGQADNHQLGHAVAAARRFKRSRSLFNRKIIHRKTSVRNKLQQSGWVGKERLLPRLVSHAAWCIDSIRPRRPDGQRMDARATRLAGKGASGRNM